MPGLECLVEGLYVRGSTDINVKINLKNYSVMVNAR